MSKKCGIKKFQKLLVYEPVNEKICRPCSKARPYPTAPPFGTTIKVCSFHEMENMCFPKLCDCPAKPIPLCKGEKRKENICQAFKILAAVAMIAALYDSGILRHPVYTNRYTERIKEMIEEHLGLDEEEEDKKADPLEEYRRAVKQYNFKNLWNATVVTVMDFFIILTKLPGKMVSAIAHLLETETDEEAHKKQIENKKADKKTNDLANKN